MIDPRYLRQQIQQVLTFASMLATAFMTWKLLSIVAYSESPIVVVLSGSMEPAFQRGDILFLWNRKNFMSVGDIVVYQIKDKAIPIVHRVMNEHHVIKNKVLESVEPWWASLLRFSSSGKQLILTKGDNNPVNDLSLYSRNQMYLDRDADLLGCVKGYVPMVGYITILLTESEYIKYGLMAIMGLNAILSNEE